jgi:hypothetical protein
MCALGPGCRIRRLPRRCQSWPEGHFWLLWDLYGRDMTIGNVAFLRGTVTDKNRDLSNSSHSVEDAINSIKEIQCPVQHLWAEFTCAVSTMSMCVLIKVLEGHRDTVLPFFMQVVNTRHKKHSPPAGPIKSQLLKCFKAIPCHPQNISVVGDRENMWKQAISETTKVSLIHIQFYSFARCITLFTTWIRHSYHSSLNHHVSSV